MRFGALPIVPLQPEVPIVAMERWRDVGGALEKVYRFREQNMRDEFVIALLSYESNVQHHADMRLREGEVQLNLQTKDTQKITELDKEYARYADILFKDITSRPAIAGEEENLA